MIKKSETLKQTFIEAYQSYKQKDFKKAENLSYKILSIDPNHFDSLNLLATLFAISANYEKAKEQLLKAIEIQPKNLSVLNNLGTAYKELGKSDEATKCYEKVLKIDPNHANAHYNLGLVFYQLKELKKAKNYFKKTCEIQTNYAAAFFCLANVHVDLKEFENAVSCYQKAIEINPNFVGAHNNLGLVYRALNDFKNAINCYEKVIKIQPNHAGTYHNLALAFKETGEFEKSIQSHEMAIKYEPENLIHYFYLSELKKDILDQKLRKKIENIVNNKNSTKSVNAYGNFILAKYEQKNKNYEKEINYLIKGHNYFFNSRKEKFSLGIKYCFDDVLQIVNGANLNHSNKKNNYDVKPIFIIGVPRCGSTVVEKIIASGEQLLPMGEETATLENYINAKILEKQSLNLGEVSEIREELFNIYKQKGLISKKYNYVFTDKSLNNFYYLELIREIYPNAKIINCKRDVLSSIVSIFQNNLTELAWTHNLENIFKYFDNYFEIIENFSSTYPNYIYHLNFESLANNPEVETKKLMKFCGLSWDKKCLEFYKRKNLISKTASNIQIRQAIYKHSLDKYLPYKKYLDKYGKKYLWYN